MFVTAVTRDLWFLNEGLGKESEHPYIENSLSGLKIWQNQCLEIENSYTGLYFFQKLVQSTGSYQNRIARNWDTDFQTINQPLKMTNCKKKRIAISVCNVPKITKKLVQLCFKWQIIVPKSLYLLPAMPFWFRQMHCISFWKILYKFSN